MFLKINDTVEVTSYMDEESDEPRTDLVGKTGTIKTIDRGIITVHFEDDDEDVVFYEYELEKL